jgi:hypothetical protein
MRKLSSCALSVIALSGCYLFHRAPGDAPSEPVDSRDLLSERADAATPLSCIERTLRPGTRAEPIDIVWVVDSSRSMGDEQARIRQTINEFVTDAEARSFDVRLVMITATNIVPPPLGSDSVRYRFVQRSVPSEAPLEALLDEAPAYMDFLRPEASLHFVIVTDDESRVSADAFRRGMDRALQRPYVVHAVASPDVAGAPCRSETPSPDCQERGERAPQLCGAAAIGREYYTLADQLGGEKISICVDDWRDVFGPLLEAVTPTDIPCTIELGPVSPSAPARVELRRGAIVRALPQVADEAACGRVGEFYYIEQPDGLQLVLCPVACDVTTQVEVELSIQVDCD